MPAYRYQALTDDGARTEGVVEAAGPEAARALLRDRGLWPLAEPSPANDDAPASLAAPRLSAADRAHMLRQLAVLVAARLAPDACLAQLAELTTDRPLRAAMARAGQRLQDGAALSAALSAEPGLLPEPGPALLAAGEAAGDLPGALSRLADLAEGKAELAEKLKSALLYPAILTLAMLLSLAVLGGFVLPRFAELFASAGKSPPAGLLAAMALTRTLAFALPALALAGIASALWLRRAGPARRAALLDRVPVAGPLWRLAALSRWASSLAALVQGGVRLADAMPLAGRASGHGLVAAASDRAARALIDGAGLADALTGAGIFPPLVAALLGAGAAAGTPGPVLEHLARLLARQASHRGQRISQLAGPILTLIFGLVVALLALTLAGAVADLNDLAF